MRLKNLLLYILFVVAVLPLAARTPQEALDEFTASAAINAPKTAVLITDLSTGRTVASHNAGLPLVPASIMKCVSTASLISELGDKFRYETECFLLGKVKDGVLDGDLLIVASGDPSLNSRHFPDTPDFVGEIVDALRAVGIHEIRGKVVIDESRFAGASVNPTWCSGDLRHAYGTGSHGFNFEDNASGSRSVSDPAAVFRSRLGSRLDAAGIALRGEETSPGKRRSRLLTHRSATLDEILRSCMMRSDNQFAEAILRTYGVAVGKDGSTAAAAEAELNRWRRDKAPAEGVAILDGSGLSRADRMTADFMTHVLTRMASDPVYASLFPLAGQEGTLRRFLAGTPLEGYAAMKTGSMNGIQCYAGYLLDDNYAPTHTIVFMLNDMANRSAARGKIADLLLEIFGPQN